MNADFARERHLVDLAIKLEHGNITPDEQREAADALSFAAGARLGHEYRANELEKRLAFVTRVLKIFWTQDCYEALFWRVDNDYTRFFVICNDTFSWATADVEEITSDNVQLLEQSVDEVKALMDSDSMGWGFLLFCARNRGIRVMPLLKVPDQLALLFDACGPERTSNDFLVG